MKILINGLLILISVQMMGCAGSLARQLMLSEADLTQEVERLKAASKNNNLTKQDGLSVVRMCIAYDAQQQPKFKKALQDLDAITPEEWTAIDQKKIFIGMSALALYCSWGDVGFNGSHHESIGEWGKRIQLVYRACQPRYCSPQYVYLDNGKISSWSN